MPIQESNSSRYALNQAKYPHWRMCSIQVQKDESTIQCESDCMHTCERCGEGGVDDTGGVANIPCISKITNVLMLTMQLAGYSTVSKHNKLYFEKKVLKPEPFNYTYAIACIIETLTAYLTYVSHKR